MRLLRIKKQKFLKELEIWLDIFRYLCYYIGRTSREVAARQTPSRRREMLVTAKEFSEKTGVSYAVGSNALKFLVGRGVVKEAGTREKPEGQRGRASTEFDVPEEKVEVNLLG
jgi:hypothetical protein